MLQRQPVQAHIGLFTVDDKAIRTLGRAQVACQKDRIDSCNPPGEVKISTRVRQSDAASRAALFRQFPASRRDAGFTGMVEDRRRAALQAIAHRVAIPRWTTASRPWSSMAIGDRPGVFHPLPDDLFTARGEDAVLHEILDPSGRLDLAIEHRPILGPVNHPGKIVHDCVLLMARVVLAVVLDRGRDPKPLNNGWDVIGRDMTGMSLGGDEERVGLGGQFDELHQVAVRATAQKTRPASSNCLR